MSYSDFLDTLISPIRLFVSALSQVADSLIHNYIIITLLGITLFISLVWLIYYTFHDFINTRIDKIEDKIDRYNKYELYKETQREYLNQHRVDEFMYLYDMTILKQQVMNGIYRNHPDVLLDNITQFNKLRAQALKNIKNEYENDNNPDNDDDIDYIIPTPPIQKSSVNELKQAEQNAWLKEYSQDLEKQIISHVDNIMDENRVLLSNHGLSYDKKNNVFFDTKTGEVVNVLERIKENGVVENQNLVNSNTKNDLVNSFENDLSHKPVSNSGKYNFLKNHPEFLSDEWVVSDKGIAINKETGEVIDM